MMGRGSLSRNQMIVSSLVLITWISGCCCSVLASSSALNSQASSSELSSFEQQQLENQQREEQEQRQQAMVQYVINNIAATQGKGHLPQSLLNMSPEAQRTFTTAVPSALESLTGPSSSPLRTMIIPPALPSPSVAEIHRLMAKFGDHPIQILLRRALRTAAANKNGLYRGRRYKAQADTNFIRFGRSSPSVFDEDQEDDVWTDSMDSLSHQLRQQQLKDDMIERQNIHGLSTPRFSYQVESPVTPQAMPVMVMMSKKARPDKYYLRFGKRSVRSIDTFGENHLHDKEDSLDMPPTQPSILTKQSP